jgi:hypothetical protein
MASRGTQGDLFVNGTSALSYLWDDYFINAVPSDSGQSQSSTPSLNDSDGLTGHSFAESDPAASGSHPYLGGPDSSPSLSDFFGSDGPTGQSFGDSDGTPTGSYPYPSTAASAPTLEDIFGPDGPMGHPFGEPGPAFAWPSQGGSMWGPNSTTSVSTFDSPASDSAGFPTGSGQGGRSTIPSTEIPGSDSSVGHHMGDVTPPPSGGGDPTDSGQDPTGANPSSNNPESGSATGDPFGDNNPALNAVYPTPASDTTNSPSGSLADLVSHDATLNFGQLGGADNGNNGGAGAGASGPSASDAPPPDTSSESVDGAPQHNFITGTVIDPWQVDGVHSDIPSVGHINSDWLLA